MPKSDPAKLTKITLSLPFGLGSAEWESDPKERQAAWELYIELVTRIGVEALPEEVGILREALSSLYGLFPASRETLKRCGPDVGISAQRFGGIAVTVLNRGLRPFLSKWHPRLQYWEALRRPEVSPQEHEREWPDEADMRKDLSKLRVEMSKYAAILAQMAGLAHQSVP